MLSAFGVFLMPGTPRASETYISYAQMADFDNSGYESDFDYHEDDFLEPEWDPEPEPDVLPRVQISQPQASNEQEKEYTAVKRVVECMNQNGLRLDKLVLALCYGNSHCSSDNSALKEARLQLMKSPVLPTILNNLHTPPSYNGARPEATSKVLDNWAWNHTTKLARTELDKFAADAREEYDKVIIGRSLLNSSRRSGEPTHAKARNTRRGAPCVAPDTMLWRSHCRQGCSIRPETAFLAVSECILTG
ncbi:hypothetical protein RSAG8_05161, partial [Rhizoctonia solani AG-8 WAC10335]